MKNTHIPEISEADQIRTSRNYNNTGQAHPQNYITIQIRTFLILILILFVTPAFTEPLPRNMIIAGGQQPQVVVDPSGTIRLIYGNEDKIYCATSSDNGVSFSAPQLIASVTGMPLGKSRGPQAASSENYTLVTAFDKDATIHSFLLNHKTGKWKETSAVNDQPKTAPEGLMNISAGENDEFYAVWLDQRNNQRNNICFSSTKDQAASWTKNKMVYISPDEHVCQCCRPSIDVSESGIYIMFRNWLNGSRDLYIVKSDDDGATFGDAVKLGEGTWKLNGCPMDGGGITTTDNGKISTVWQRAGSIYYAKPGQEEKLLGSGRDCSISGAGNPVITWQDGRSLKVLDLLSGKETDAGEGGFIKAVRTQDEKILCAWENNDEITVCRF